MKNPNTTMELAGAIEMLIGSYMNEVRGAAQLAVERAFDRAANGRQSRRRPSASGAIKTDGRRRTAAELDQTCHALCEAVRTHPGSSMAALAEKLGGDAKSLQRPMAKLKLAGRVRSVGKRRLTRYYPAVNRAVANKD